ncbi:hypothetical protein NVP1174O_30 [Vibrio phage 1.174.O._10N.261.55.A8]|nr:hypothetical protein NVP1174O_30 [Vibrio phage 1.174.O._10N.261.55.A8]
MKEQVKVGITKEAYEKIQHVDFSAVGVKLKALRCELNLNDKTEKDHCAILDIELPQEENKMNIDKVETQTEHQEAMSAFSGDVWHDAHHHCKYHELGDDVIIEFEHEDSNFVEKISVAEAKCITKNPMRHTKRWRLIPKTKEAYWVNGDKCIYNDGEFTFVSYMCNPEEDYVVIWRPIDGVKVVYKTQISKPETKQQREDRERLEVAYDLCQIAMPHLKGAGGFEIFKSDADAVQVWTAILDRKVKGK